MDMPRIINLLLIIVGGFVAIYAKAGMAQNQYVLIAGIVMLMIGVYRISKRIPSKKDQDRSSDNEHSV